VSTKDSQDHTPVRWPIVLAIVMGLAIVALLAFARGDDSDDGRSPEPGHALAEPVSG
jgi:hypothetical protein